MRTNNTQLQKVIEALQQHNKQVQEQNKNAAATKELYDFYNKAGIPCLLFSNIKEM